MRKSKIDVGKLNYACTKLWNHHKGYIFEVPSALKVFVDKLIISTARHVIFARGFSLSQSLSQLLLFTMLAWGISLTLSAQESAQILPPENDNFENAQEISGAAFELNADLGAATTEDFESTWGWTRTAWWVWIAPTNGILTWNGENSSNKVIVRILAEGAFGFDIVGASYIRSGSPWNYGFDQKGSAQVQQGKRYFLQLDLSYPFGSPLPGSKPTTRPASVRFECLQGLPPANDTFAKAIALPGNTAIFSANLEAATSEPNEPQINDAALHRTLWWTWQAPGYGSASIRRLSTNAQSFSAPIVNIFAPGPFLALTRVASSATEYGNDCERHWAARDIVNWDTVAGAQYSIQVDRFPAFSDASATFQFVFTSAPSNDIPESATILTGTNLSLTISNRGATGRRGEILGAGQYGASSIWFKWQSPSQGIVQLTKDIPVQYDEPHQNPTDQTGVIIVSHGPPCSARLWDLDPLPQFAPVFRLFQGERLPDVVLADYVGTNAISWEATGETYWIQMDGVSGTEGETPMNLLFTPPPINDRFTDRIRLGNLSVRASGRTYAATPFSIDSQIEAVFHESNNTLNRSAWWEWQAPASGRWTLFLSRGRDENRLVLYPESGPGAPNYISTTTSDPIVFQAETGQTFQIAAFARTRFGSSLEFTITSLTAPALRYQNLTPAYNDSRFITVLTSDNSGLPFVIERSPNLVEWTRVLTITNAFSSAYTLPISAHSGAGFFRTHLDE